MVTGEFGVPGQLVVPLVEVELKPEQETVTLLLLQMVAWYVLGQQLKIRLAILLHVQSVSTRELQEWCSNLKMLHEGRCFDVNYILSYKLFNLICLTKILFCSHIYKIVKCFRWKLGILDCLGSLQCHLWKWNSNQNTKLWQSCSVIWRCYLHWHRNW